MLPANHGDCLWIEYGAEDDRHRVLIDGGPEYAFPHIQERIPEGGCHFDLLVVTHIDRDHIGGILKLLTHLPEGVTFGDIWFNAHRHLREADELGPAQGEMLSAVIERRGLPWNEAFGGSEHAVKVGDDAAPRELLLPGGMKMTLLSPTMAELRALKPVWEKEVKEHGIEPGSTDDALAELRRREHVPPDLLGKEKGPPNPAKDATEVFVSDDSKANGSSIVLLAEYDGRSALLVGDAYPSLVKRSLAHLAEGTFRTGALKLSHHGSKKNTDADLIKAIACPHYLISTDGAIYGHPHHAGIARTIASADDGTTLHFNYRTEWNGWWDDDGFKATYGYEADYPADGKTGLTVGL